MDEWNHLFVHESIHDMRMDGWMCLFMSLIYAGRRTHMKVLYTRKQNSADINEQVKSSK